MSIQFYTEFPCNAGDTPARYAPVYMPIAGKYESSGFSHGLNDYGDPRKLAAYVREAMPHTIERLRRMPPGRLALNLSGHIGLSSKKLVKGLDLAHHVAALRVLAEGIKAASLHTAFKRRWLVYADVEGFDFTPDKLATLRPLLWDSRWWEAGHLPKPAICVWYQGAGRKGKGVLTPDGTMPPDNTIDGKTSFVMGYLCRPRWRARYNAFAKHSLWNSAIDAINAVIDARAGGYEPVPLICGALVDENGKPIERSEWWFRCNVVLAMVEAGARRFVVFNQGYRDASTGVVTERTAAAAADRQLCELATWAAQHRRSLRARLTPPPKIRMDADTIRVGGVSIAYGAYRGMFERSQN